MVGRLQTDPCPGIGLAFPDGAGGAFPSPVFGSRIRGFHPARRVVGKSLAGCRTHTSVTRYGNPLRDHLCHWLQLAFVPVAGTPRRPRAPLGEHTVAQQGPLCANRLRLLFLAPHPGDESRPRPRAGRDNRLGVELERSRDPWFCFQQRAVSDFDSTGESFTPLTNQRLCSLYVARLTSRYKLAAANSPRVHKAAEFGLVVGDDGLTFRALPFPDGFEPPEPSRLFFAATTLFLRSPFVAFPQTNSLARFRNPLPTRSGAFTAQCRDRFVCELDKPLPARLEPVVNRRVVSAANRNHVFHAFAPQANVGPVVELNRLARAHEARHPQAGRLVLPAEIRPVLRREVFGVRAEPE